MLRRIVPSLLILTLLSAAFPARALATSTAAEIQMGQEEDQQIVSSSVIETDPLLNAYVSGIAENLWNQVARKDVPYSVKIIKDDEINSFATMGGFVYINEGLIDFVQSDDELSSVVGHETGHIERRHVLTANSKAQILNILFGIASMFSPLVYNLGGLAEAGIMAKVSREDELQADRYGLQLMSRAGYDPDSMVTMMAHLAEMGDEHNDMMTKYLQDHPNPDARVAHLVGYPELDPKTVTTTQEIVQASGDEERARYEFSSVRLNDILKANPQNPEALLELGQDDLALGLTGKGEQTLAEAAQLGSPETRATANARIAALRQMEAERVELTHPNLPKLQAAVQASQASQQQTAAQVQARAQEGRDQLKAINARISSIEYELPDFSRINIKRGSRVEAIVKNLGLMARSINSALQDAGTAIGGVGSLQKDKESGLLKESADIYDEMLEPFTLTPIPTDSLAILPSYPQMLNDLGLADGDMVRSVDAARASLTILDQSVGDLDEFLKDLDHVDIGYNGDISQSTYDQLAQPMAKAAGEFNGAATAASQAAQLYNLARSRQLSTRITHARPGHVAAALLDAAIRAAAALRYERHRLPRDAARRPHARRRGRRDDSRRRHQEHARGDRRRSQELQSNDRRRRQRSRHARLAARDLHGIGVSRLHRRPVQRTAQDHRQRRHHADDARVIAVSAAASASELFKIVRKGIDVKSVHAHTRKPFRYLLCGDPGYVAELRAVLLSGHDDTVPLDAAACLETVVPGTPLITQPSEVRAVIFLGRQGDLAGANLASLAPLRVPMLAITVASGAAGSGPPSAPAPGTAGEYVVPELSRDALRGRVFPHLVDASHGVEIAVGRRLPPLRETVAAKLTRDAAKNALKVSLASAVVDQLPFVGVVLGAFASAGDMVAITGIQTMLMLHIQAAYGRDPDMGRMWQLLPVIGGGFGWRTLARELTGFIPVAGIAIKGAIAYAGTIVVGEGVTFFLENGHSMSKGQAARIYERTKAEAMRVSRDVLARLRNR